MSNTSTPTRNHAAGFTLVEILIALSILAMMMTILYSTFSTASLTARAIEERADELASLTGALDTVSPEVRGAYEQFSAKKSAMTFTTMTPFRDDNAPLVQTVSYEFSEGRILRKLLRSVDAPAEPGVGAPGGRVFVLLEAVTGGSFAFFDGKQWTDEWGTPDKLPAGVKVSFSYRQTDVQLVIPVWRGSGK